VNITVRGLSDKVFRRFKAKATEEDMKLGEAMTQAMELWIRQRAAKPRANLLDIKPFDWGEGTREVSVEIDRILYGENRG
jgi:hypothetical protein